MRDWIMPIGFDHADAEAKHLIAIADDNKVYHLLTFDSVLNLCFTAINLERKMLL